LNGQMEEYIKDIGKEWKDRNKVKSIDKSRHFLPSQTEYKFVQTKISVIVY
jgi:hypothetical protein